MEYGRIDVSEGIGVNKSDGSCDCIICYYWYFLKINLKFCNGCYAVIPNYMSFNDVAIVSAKK